MIRAVVDTNTLVSGFGWGGPPGAVVDAVLDSRLGLVTSPPLLAELDRVLRYPKLAAVFPDPDRIVALIAAVAETVEPATRLRVVADEADNRVLEAARPARSRSSSPAIASSARWAPSAASNSSLPRKHSNSSAGLRRRDSATPARGPCVELLPGVAIVIH